MPNPNTARPLGAATPAARTAAQVASDATRRIEQASAKAGATERVKVVATKRGYDNRKVREEGEEFFVFLKPGEALAPWQQRKEEYDAEASTRAAAADAEDDES